MSRRSVEQSEGVKAEAILARSGRTFHLASRLLPPRMRSEAAELYAFCRRMDDLADEEGTADLDVRSRQLEQVLQVLQTDPLSDVAESLGWPVELEMRFPGISRIAMTLTESLAADIGARSIADERELLVYAFGVAGTVGLMMCRILGAPPAGAEAAAHLGIAMQLTNIARDIREDLERDRIYLPATWISSADVKAAIAAAPVSPDAPAVARLVQTIRRLLALAERFYRSADAGMHYLPWRARLSILAASACYREIGVRVEQDIAASWQRRTVVPFRVKARLVLWAFLHSFRTGDRWSKVDSGVRDKPSGANHGMVDAAETLVER